MIIKWNTTPNRFLTINGYLIICIHGDVGYTINHKISISMEKFKND